MLDRNHYLVEANLALLEQGLQLLVSLDDETYSQRLHLLFSNRIGAQVRHVLEFYECFLDGLPEGHIDYDARKRDERVEISRAAASEKLQALIGRLASATVRGEDGLVWVRMEDAPAALGDDALLTSSVSRELQVLISHTVHHYALIAVALRMQGQAVDANFGIAPSTLRHQQKRAA
ncbi:MAG: hypothetical protein JNL62_14830 [Bryobacterales bacterium]|nr:hypothetical protein [Bryobacterales bacterium]